MTPGADAYARTGEYISQGLYDSLEETRVGLKGPVGDSDRGGGFSSINVALRKKYELFANFQADQESCRGWRPGTRGLT